MPVTSAPAPGGLVQLSPAPAVALEPARRRRAGAGTQAAATLDARTAARSVQAQGATQTLPMSVSAGIRISASGWLLPIAGAVVGGLVFSLPGAVLGGLAGWLLSR